MKLSHSSMNLLEEAICKAVGKLANGGEASVITDIHLQPNPTSGELAVFDDEDNELATATLEEWMGYQDENFYAKAEQLLAGVLAALKEKGAFEKTNIVKPYSFVLVDEEKETLAELLLMDDDTLLVNDELLKGLDEELDAFLKELLEK